MRDILTLLLILIPLSGYSDNKWQDIIQHSIPKSPEAAAYDKVTDIPVSMYAGRPNLSIPLYTVTSGDISLPISLDYDGGAIRVDQEATWVGLNWNLNAGGCITVNSVAGHSNRSSSSVAPGDYENRWKRLFNNAITREGYASGDFQIPYKFDGMQPGRGRYGFNWLCGYNADTQDLDAALYDEILNYHNGECPVYHAVFMGNSLTFVWDPFRSEFFQTGLRKNFRISGTPGSYITLTDGRGVSYGFQFKEKIFPVGSDADMDHYTYDGTYYLTSIKSPTGHAISLAYTEEGGYYPVRHVSERLYDKEYPYSILFDSYCKSGANPTATTDAMPSVTLDTLSLVRSISPYFCINKCRLASITADSLTVAFNACSVRKDLNFGKGKGNARTLDNIEIYKKEGGKKAILKKYSFSYSYFQKNETGGNTLKDYWHKMAASTDVYSQYYPNDDFIYLRLKLDKLTEYGSDGTAKPSYEFGYYDGLPGKNSAAQDYWGYYNGRENKNGVAAKDDVYDRTKRYHTLIPRHYSGSEDGLNDASSSLQGYLNLYGADRRTNYRYVTVGMLFSVKYPSGGKESLSYRQNTFTNLSYESADTADVVPSYFTKTITTYKEETSHTLTVKTCDHEKYEPLEQRGINSCVFTLDKVGTVSWQTTYSSNVKGHLASIAGHKAALYKINNDGNTTEDGYVVSSVSLASTTLPDKSSETVSKSLQLTAGTYRINIDKLTEDDDDYCEITSTLSSPQGSMTYNKKTEGKPKYQALPTLGTSSSVSTKAVSSLTVYECNQKNYSSAGASRGHQSFLIEKPQRINIYITYSKADGRTKSWWRNFIHAPVTLLKYDIRSDFYSSYEYVCSSKTIGTSPTDTLNGTASKTVTMILQPGRYEAVAPSIGIDGSNGVFYEITATLSLDPRSTLWKAPSYGDGVSVASVSRVDGDTVSVSRYSYSDCEGWNSTGRLSSPVIFARKKMLVYQQQPSGTDSNPAAKEIIYTYASSDNQCANGSSVGYDRVSKAVYGGSEKLLVESQTFWNRNWVSGSMWYFIPAPEDPRNGLVLSDTIYEAGGWPLKAVSNNYKIENTENRLVNASIENVYYGPRGSFKLASAAGGGIMDICLYSNPQFAMSSTKETTSSFYGDNLVTQTKQTDFNKENGLPSTERLSTSIKDEEIVTEYLYPDSTFKGQPFADSLMAAHINEVPIQTTVLVGKSGSSILRSSEVVKYNGIGQPVSYYTKDIAGTISSGSFQRTNKNNFDLSGYTRRLSIAYSGKYHNPTTFTDQGGFKTVLTWGYDNLYPTFMARGGQTRKYEFKPYIGLTKIIQPNGNWESYAYDGFQRLSTVTGVDGVTRRYGYHYGRNYTKTITPLDASESNSITALQYYDGLGRPVLAATNGMGGEGRGVYTMQDFDGMDRAVRTYLPAVGGGNLDYQSGNSISALARQTYGDSHAYSDVAYDALGRETYTQSPGDEWHRAHKGVAKRYVTNGRNDVKLYTAPTDGKNSLVKSGYYAPNMLMGEQTTDEDGHSLTVFTDKLGRKVLERRASDEGSNDTYFVYNDLGQLRSVLSPEYQNDQHKAIFAYEYRYDNRGNVVKKILPQCEYIQYWYDTADRLIYMQDGRMRTKGIYRFYLYDNLSRLVVEGTCSSCNRGGTVTHTTFNASNSGFLNTGYTFDHNLNLGNPKLEVVNYYDDYRFLNLQLFKNNKALKKGVNPSNPTCAKGQATGAITATSNGDLLLSTLYYDLKGEITESHRTLPDDALLVTKNTYSFTGNVDETRQILYKGGKTYTVSTDNGYSQYNDKLDSIRLAVDGGSIHDIAAFAYDDLGRLESRSYGSSTHPIENISYFYNLRGWVTDIVNSNFEEHLTYCNGQGIPCYNGNISTQQWKIAKDRNRLRGYKFTYDKLNRLMNAVYGEETSFNTNQGYYSETITNYTANGAITGIVRNGLTQLGAYAAIDSLDITLNGNQLERVDDKADPVLRSGSFDFYDNKVKTDGAEYEYDENGALTMDANRGITKIEYDLRNNPTLIQFSDGSQTEYVYTAGGEKLKTIHHKSSPFIHVQLQSAMRRDSISQIIPPTGGTLKPFTIMSVDSTDYIENFIFENGKPDKYLFYGGYYTYATPAAGYTRYHYYITDHLGNNRVVFNENDSIEQTTHYYPFGAVYADTGYNPNFQKYKYTGKELDLTHGLNTYDHGARQNYSILGVWDRVDPLAEKHYNISSYSVCFSNPIHIIDSNGQDGLLSGNGTEEDPYLITANYYYNNNGDFDKKQIKSMQEAINSYNNNGNAFKIGKGKNAKYIKFALSLSGVENAQEATSRDTEIGLDNGQEVTVKYGNEVKVGIDTGEEFGSADKFNVYFNTENINNSGLPVDKLVEGVMVHEIGHNLGLIHEDGGSIMANVKHFEFSNNVINNGIKPENNTTYPYVSRAALKPFILNVIDKSRRDVGTLHRKKY